MSLLGENLAEYIAQRPSILLKKDQYESFKGRVLFDITYSEYFRENLHIFEIEVLAYELRWSVYLRRCRMSIRWLVRNAVEKWKSSP